ncbi:DNA translocase FtsK [Bacillus sp. B190/17]|uniref:DNA translocase FtsK n=1 Tax=Bacillus lumedeiriae TaxID=3058829 RepID=A0ABW8I5D6_9BACI
MSFFKKIIGLFREEIDDEFEQYDEPLKHKETILQRTDEQTMLHSVHGRTPDTQEMETRVTYRYPSQELLPRRHHETPPRPRRERRSDRQAVPDTQEKHGEYRYVQEEVVPPVKPVKASPAYKLSPGPFKPTEIPSPVYGFRKRPLNETKNIEKWIDNEDQLDSLLSPVLEHEPDSTGMAIEKQEEVIVAPSSVFEKEESVPEPSNEEPLLLFKVEEKKKVFDAEAMPSFRAEEESAAAVIEKEEQPVVDPPLQEEPIVQVEMEEEITPQEKYKEELPEEKNVLQTEESRPKRRQTPFNVVMLKKDREAWEKREKGSSQPSVQLVPAEEEAPVGCLDLEPEYVSEQTKKQEEPEQEMAYGAEPDYYVFPYETYLSPPIVKETEGEWVESQSEVLNETFKNFNVKAAVVNVTVGPSVTRFEVEPERGVKVSKITNLTDDIKRSLAARNLRIEAPIPGTQVIGIEVPNKKSRPVQISEIISSSVFKDHSSPLTSALGLDISGEPVVLDLKKMPHGLIAGATGSGKSVCINSILVSLLYKAAPHELKLMLIDPKMVELAPYNGIPHLVSPVITDVKAATAALKWAVEEMERRYELFVHSGVRDITKYNEKVKENGQKSQHLPYIVIIIDELADLMMMSPADVEEAICRIAQKARACGIHLIVATQRPSVDVITGLIKANIPTRIAFSVSSQVDSRTIIDTGGAEKLLGRGDMLFLNNGASETVRLQGTFVSDDEIDTIVAHVRKEQEPQYLFQQEDLLQKAALSETEDELFLEACEFVVRQGGASTSLLQRHFKVGYNRAARLIEMMETQGLVSGQRAGKPREVLMTEEELHALNESSMS